jgi:hypothetical protein
MFITANARVNSKARRVEGEIGAYAGVRGNLTTRGDVEGMIHGTSSGDLNICLSVRAQALPR